MHTYSKYDTYIHICPCTHTNISLYVLKEYGNDADEDDDDDDESREEEDKETKEKLDDDFKWAAMIEVIEKMVLSMITIFQVW